MVKTVYSFAFKMQKIHFKKTYERNIKLLQIAQMIRYVNTLIEFRKEKKLSTGSFLFFAFFAFKMSSKQNFTQKKNANYSDF